MLSGPIYDRPHALLHSPVLGVDTINTRVGLSLLDLAIDQPVVAFVAERAERGLVHVIRAIAAAALQPVCFGQGLVPEAIHPVPDHAILVIHRHPEVPRGPRTYALALQAELLRPDLRKGHDEMVGAYIGLPVLQRPNPSIAGPIVGGIHFQRRCAAPDKWTREWNPRPGSRGGNVPMQDRRMRGVDASFQGLQPVALLDDFRDMTMALGHMRPLKVRRWRHFGLGAHVGPDDPTQFNRGVGRRTNFMGETALGGFVHLLHAGTVHIKLPTVIHAAQAG